MGEDEQKKTADQIQKMTDSTIGEIDSLLATKEGEITQV
jgi:ribosome recycling factor